MDEAENNGGETRATSVDGPWFRWHDPRWWSWLGSHKRCPSLKALRAHLIEPFRGIVVFHGCRPSDVQSYFQDGIRIADHNALDQFAKTFFLSGRFPELTEEHFRSALESTFNIDDRKVYLAVDDRHLLKCAGHYLIYGSERLIGIAARLHKFGVRDYRNALKTVGRPTLLKVVLPFEKIPPHQLRDFLELTRFHAWESRKDKHACPFDCTFALSEAVPKELLVGHEHPSRIPDPLHGSIPYLYQR